MNKISQDEREFFAAFNSLRSSYQGKSKEEREGTINALVSAYEVGRYSMPVMSILSFAIDPANFRRIIAARVPGFESFLAECEAANRNSHANSHGLGH